jgi:DNA-binding NtrC family response regulator
LRGFSKKILLNVITLAVPPLRERIEDIPLLARHFITRYKIWFSTIDDIAKPARSLLMRCNWPGNVRELENAIQRPVAMVRSAIILSEDLPPTLNPDRLSQLNSPADPMDDSMAVYERAAILNALAKSSGNRKRAAEIDLSVLSSLRFRAKGILADPRTPPPPPASQGP